MTARWALPTWRSIDARTFLPPARGEGRSSKEQSLIMAFLGFFHKSAWEFPKENVESPGSIRFEGTFSTAGHHSSVPSLRKKAL